MAKVKIISPCFVADVKGEFKDRKVDDVVEVSDFHARELVSMNRAEIMPEKGSKSKAEDK